MLTKRQFGLVILDVSTKQCQEVTKQCLKNSCSQDMNRLAQVSSDKSTYDNFNITKIVVKAVRNDTTNNLKEDLTMQDL